jgi:predicted acyltransferase
MAITRMPQELTPKPEATRLASLDALRGFDMLWIVGADAIGDALAHFRGGAPVRFMAAQLDHVPWEGFHAYDLIFPLFVFLAGVSIPLSLGRIESLEGPGAAWRRLIRRTLVLYLLGLFYYGGLSTPLHGLRLLGVLQRIGICYGISGAVYLNFKARDIAATVAVLLLGYWALLRFVPVPGSGAGDFAEGHNLANWLDAHFLPLRKWDGDHDPEGILSTGPAVASCLLGVLSGLWLSRADKAGVLKAAVLVTGGLLSVVAGHLWGAEFPIIKKIWTSSFVLVTAGWSAVLLGSFYLVIDVFRLGAWAAPFVWVGSNSIAIYLLSNIVDVGRLSERFAGGDVAQALNAAWPGLGGLTLALIGIGFCFAFCRFLYVRKIFFRI